MTFMQSWLVPGKGAGAICLSRALTLLLLGLLAGSAAHARTRIPRLRRYSAAQEPQFTRSSPGQARASGATGSHASRTAQSPRGGGRAAAGVYSSRLGTKTRTSEDRNSRARDVKARNIQALGTRTYGTQARNTPGARAEPASGSRKSPLSQRGATGRARDLQPRATRQQVLPANRLSSGNRPGSARAPVPETTADLPQPGSTAPAPASAGMFARGQSAPPDDERLPVNRAALPAVGSASVAPATPQPPGAAPQPGAMVSSNDPLAVPSVRPPALRTLSEPAPSETGAERAGRVAEPQPGPERGAAPADRGRVGVSPDEVSPALARPSRQELAEEAVQPLVLPGLYRDGRLVMPAPLKGSREVLVHQNRMADQAGLARIRNDGELNRLRASHQLVDIPESASLHVNPELSGDRRCARVWTMRFAVDIGRAFYARFDQPLELSSAVRTVQFQLRLQRVNGNAAQVGGDTASPHLTGQAIDLGKGTMSRDQIAWMRAYLLPLMQAGKIDVEEEFQQSCFHISVYPAYDPAGRHRPGARLEEAQLH